MTWTAATKNVEPVSVSARTQVAFYLKIMEISFRYSVVVFFCANQANSPSYSTSICNIFYTQYIF